MIKHRVAEIDRAALPIGQTTIIQDLQQRIPHFRVCLFDLVEQDHTVRAMAHCFGELAAFFVAHVTRRSTEQA